MLPPPTRLPEKGAYMKKRMTATLLAAACCCVACTGCTSVTSGVVTNKKYVAAHDETWYYRTNYCIIPVTKHHAAEYQLQLQDTIDGKVKTDWITVSEDIYNQYQVSDLYP